MDFGEIIRNTTQQHSARPAVVFEGAAQTYQELFDRACRLANGLRNLGLVPGDRVAVLGPNSAETVEQIAGLALANLARATLYEYYAMETNAYLMDLIGARVLLTTADRYAALRPFLNGLTTLEHVVVLGDDPPEATVSYERLLRGSDAADPLVRAAPNDVHLIRFSSGTTGRPKGIFHSTEAWLGYNSEYRWVVPALDERDRYLSPGSLSHLGIAFVWGTLATGGAMLPMPKFDAARVVELIEQERATTATLVPTMIDDVVSLPGIEDRDLSSVRCLLYAGSPISEKTMHRAIDLFGDSLYQLYAQSEVAPVAVLRGHEHRALLGARTPRLRAAGRATPYVRLRIVDDAGDDVAPGEIGEIAACSPGGMTGIWGDPEATATRFLPDGCIRTRDVGYVDEEGYLFVVDRKDDMIISGGYNIWPAEIEQALQAHPAVTEACVVGGPHQRWGETPVATVVLLEGATADADELIEFVTERVGRVKRPSRIRFMTELPRSAAGKILRSTLRQTIDAEAALSQ